MTGVVLQARLRDELELRSNKVALPAAEHALVREGAAGVLSQSQNALASLGGTPSP